MNAPRPWAPASAFRQSVRYFPLPSVSAAIQNEAGEILYVMRKNNPAKGLWWLPGGRILNGETVADALARVLRDETGLDGEVVAVSPEYSEELWSTEGFDAEDWQRYEPDTEFIHYLGISAYVKVEGTPTIILDDQSSQVLWSKTLPHEHPLLVAYFDALARMGHELR